VISLATTGTASSARDIPLGRLGDPRDIAATVVFLASEQASWITVEAWNVDGGMLTVR
jgi:3-oxoacyl-[acyl-carrier protein] reductase